MYMQRTFGRASWQSAANKAAARAQTPAREAAATSGSTQYVSDCFGGFDIGVLHFLKFPFAAYRV